MLRFDSVDHGLGKTLNPEILEEPRSLRAPEILGGQEWTRIICSVPTKVLRDPSTLSAKIDVLKFADGSIWGPAALRESHQLIGKLDGMDFIEKDTELKKFVSPISPERGPLPRDATESQTIGPLRFDSGIWRDERGQDKLAVQVTNESDSPIRGYVFTTTFFDPEHGATIRRVSTKELETQGDPSRYLAPHQAWVADPRKFSYLPDGSIARYKITLDLLSLLMVLLLGQCILRNQLNFWAWSQESTMPITSGKRPQKLESVRGNLGRIFPEQHQIETTSMALTIRLVRESTLHRAQ